jgi:hypothetical protein
VPIWSKFLNHRRRSSWRPDLTGPTPSLRGDGINGHGVCSLVGPGHRKAKKRIHRWTQRRTPAHAVMPGHIPRNSIASRALDPERQAHPSDLLPSRCQKVNLTKIHHDTGADGLATQRNRRASPSLGSACQRGRSGSQHRNGMHGATSRASHLHNQAEVRIPVTMYNPTQRRSRTFPLTVGSGSFRVHTLSR